MTSSVINKKVFVSCGEMSGDLHLSYIIEEIKKNNKDVEFHGQVGELSIKAGAICVNNIANNDVMGFVKKKKKYNYFKRKIKEYIEYIERNNIKNVIFVDYGGFNLAFFKELKKKIKDVKCIYYIPPKVWAWGKNRIKTLKKFDEIIVIYPFEKIFFDSENMNNVTYLGNPFIDKYKFSDKLGENILLLPGSRKQEIEKSLSVFFDLIKKDSDRNYILKLASDKHRKYLNEEWLKLINLQITSDKLEKIRDKIYMSVSTSGTVTFELALMGVPQVVVYKTSKINEFIVKKILKIKYITLTNLCANKQIYPELLQNDFNYEKILENINNIGNSKETMVNLLKEERNKLGNSGVIEKLAKHIIKKIK